MFWSRWSQVVLECDKMRQSNIDKLWLGINIQFRNGLWYEWQLFIQGVDNFRQSVLQKFFILYLTASQKSSFFIANHDLQNLFLLYNKKILDIYVYSDYNQTLILGGERPHITDSNSDCIFIIPEDSFRDHTLTDPPFGFLYIFKFTSR